MDTDFMNTALLENKLNPKCWWKEPVRNSVTDPVCLNELKALIDRLEAGEALTKDEWVRLIDGRSPELAAYLFPKARAIRERVYGTDVYVRGLIEYSNYCKNNRKSERKPLPAFHRGYFILLPKRLLAGFSYLRPSGRRRSIHDRR